MVGWYGYRWYGHLREVVIEHVTVIGNMCEGTNYLWRFSGIFDLDLLIFNRQMITTYVFVMVVLVQMEKY